MTPIQAAAMSVDALGVWLAERALVLEVKQDLMSGLYEAEIYTQGMPRSLLVRTTCTNWAGAVGVSVAEASKR